MKNQEGFNLHGGPIDEQGNADFFLTYHALNGQIRASLLAAAIQLTDVNHGDGGFCVLRGSHKSNFKVPSSFAVGDPRFRDWLHQPVTEAGDVVLFAEATTHGTLPWSPSAKSERRACLFRFAPSHIAYSRSYYPRCGLNYPRHYINIQ